MRIYQSLKEASNIQYLADWQYGGEITGTSQEVISKMNKMYGNPKVSGAFRRATKILQDKFNNEPDSKVTEIVGSGRTASKLVVMILNAPVAPAKTPTSIKDIQDIKMFSKVLKIPAGSTYISKDFGVRYMLSVFSGSKYSNILKLFKSQLRFIKKIEYDYKEIDGLPTPTLDTNNPLIKKFKGIQYLINEALIDTIEDDINLFEDERYYFMPIKAMEATDDSDQRILSTFLFIAEKPQTDLI